MGKLYNVLITDFLDGKLGEGIDLPDKESPDYSYWLNWLIRNKEKLDAHKPIDYIKMAEKYAKGEQDFGKYKSQL